MNGAFGKNEPLHEGNMPRPYEDVRQWLELGRIHGRAQTHRGRRLDLEIGTMAELIYRERTGTIPRCSSTRSKAIPRVFAFSSASRPSYRRLALMAGLPMDSVGLKLVSRFKEKLNTLRPVPPRIVKTGPVFENTLSGNAIDVLKFPVPKGA
jgi:4-hydroxy-3-polyprenylbenzoate decarboxylase